MLEIHPPELNQMAQNWNPYRYLLLGTLRKNGAVVDTPVWFAVEGDHLYVFSNGDAGKIKRLRNNRRVRIAPCTMLGKPLGAHTETLAQILSSPAAIAVARRALLVRYGWQMRLLDLGARISGRERQRAWIAIGPV